MKYTILLLMTIVVFTDCQSHQTKNKDNITKYPKEVITLKIEKLYDKTKWYIYCSSVDRKVKFRESQNFVDTGLTYGMLPLNFESVEVYSDTTIIKFYFTFQGKILNGQTVLNEPAWGCVFIGKSEKIREAESRNYYSSGTVCDDSTNCPDMFDNIDMVAVGNYINSNKNTLDTWFRKEAIKRGVIK